MKRFFIITALLFVGISTSQAQSLGDMLNAFMGRNTSAKQTTEPKSVFPTERELTEQWTYLQLEMECEGNDVVAMALSSVKSQFLELGEQIGLTAGQDYIRFNNNGTFVLGLSEKEILASYTYIPPTGNLIIKLSNGTDTLLVTATATLDGERLKIMFNAKELMAIADEHLPSLQEDTMWALATTMVNNYDGITIGAIFE